MDWEVSKQHTYQRGPQLGPLVYLCVCQMVISGFLFFLCRAEFWEEFARRERCKECVPDFSFSLLFCSECSPSVTLF